MPFAPKSQVIRPTEPGRIGVTTGRNRTQGGLMLVEVAWGVNQREFVPEQFLKMFDPTNGPDIDRTSLDEVFGRAEDLRRVLTFEKLNGSLHDFLYSMDAAQIDFLPYQFRPVLKFIDSPTERLLIADEVGLGKTIESALIWLELQARRDAKRLLVVCPNMLAGKWRRELREKFGFQAEIGNLKDVRQAADDFAIEGEKLRFAWICTYTGLRPPKKDLAHLSDDDESEISERGQLARILTNWEQHHETKLFDLVIFDEAHYMRNPEASTSRLGSALSNAAEAVLCVSATPVNNRSTDLFTLLRFLDPDVFESQFLFDALLAENQPAVAAMRALRRLPEPDLPLALANLKSLEKSAFVGKSELLKRAISDLETLKKNDRGELLRVQEMTEGVNVLGSYISRTRRSQVQSRQPIREPIVVPVNFSKEEMTFYKAITRMVRDRVAATGNRFSAFHLVMPQQRMASCIPAMVDAFRQGDFGSPDEILFDSFDLDPDDFEIDESINFPADLKALFSHDYSANDTKFAKLWDVLDKLGQQKVIIFAFYKATLFYLARRLETKGIRCSLIHGSITEQQKRDDEINRFRDDSSVRVLLSSEVGSEGIDLQFCHVVINYDLPWNPMRIAQRIGRIDRVGQQADKLVIVHFKVRDTIEERLYDRLHTKLLLAENSLGDMEAILGQEIQKLTIELLSQQLSPEQETERIEQTERALEKHRQELVRLESEGASLVAHSDYISDKVNQNRTLGRYLSAEELRHYISDFFDRQYPGCRLLWDAPEKDLFQLDLTFEALEALRDYVRLRKMDVPADQITKKFTATLIPEVAKKYQFGSSIKVTLVNHLVPLVKWITEEFDKQGGFHRISAVRLVDHNFEPGIYAFRVERWKFTGLRQINQMAYAAGRLSDARLLDADSAERLLNVLAKKSKSWLSPHVPGDAFSELIQALGRDLQVRFDDVYADFQARNQTLLTIQRAQIENHFRRRRALDERRIETLRVRQRSVSLIKAAEGKIAKDQERRSGRLAILETKATTGFVPSEVAIGAVLIEEDNTDGI